MPTIDYKFSVELSEEFLGMLDDKFKELYETSDGLIKTTDSLQKRVSELEKQKC